MSGRYESRYVRAVDPRAPRGIWIRNTVLRRPGAAPAGSLWCTVWDAAAGPPVTVKATTAVAADPRRIGAARFDPAAVCGAAAAGPRHAAWDLAIHDAAPPLRHLPHASLYRAPLPRTKLESPAPLARMSGTVEADGRRLELDGWPGMVGHNWGAQHAERWLWLHGVGFDGADGAWLDLAAGRVRVGPGDDAVDRQRRAVPRRAPPRPRRPARAARRRGPPGAATLALGEVRIRATAPAGQAVAWVYADPPGREHHALTARSRRSR